MSREYRLVERENGLREVFYRIQFSVGVRWGWEDYLEFRVTPSKRKALRKLVELRQAELGRVLVNERVIA